MDLHSFLRRPELQLPLKRETEDFQAFVESTLDQYIEHLRRLVRPDILVHEVKACEEVVVGLCEVLKQTVRLALSGRVFQAYSHFSEGMAVRTQFLDQLSVSVEEQGLGTLFRVRRDLTPVLKREDLFHVPFEARHNVGVQRYSIPGLPCLYLGGSLYTCWCEMGRPPFHELQVAAFWLAPKKSVKVISLYDRPSRLFLRLPRADAQYGKDKDRWMAHFMLWPLMALCSIMTRHRKGAFKPEYIVPQFLLQWAQESGCYDGVCYFSMHVPDLSPFALGDCNFVFPARDMKASGRCSHLRALFKMTEPVSWQLLRAMDAGAVTRPRIHYPEYDVEFIEGMPERYGSTEFGLVEERLHGLVFQAKSRIGRGECDVKE